MPPTDPWEEAAKNYKAQPQDTSAPTGGDDWKIWQQGGEQDDRNGFQKMVDSATQRHDPNYAQMGPLSRALDNFGRGAAGAMLSPIAHPLDAMNGAISAVSHPVDAAKSMAKGVRDEVQQNGAMSIPYALGSIGGGLIAGEASAPLVRGAMWAPGKAAEMAGATGDSLKLMGTRAITKGSPGQLLQSALKPGVKYGAGVAGDLEKALPDVIQADPKLKGVGGFAKAADAAKEVPAQKYNDVIAPYRRPEPGAHGPFRDDAIDGKPIADAQMHSIPTMNLLEDTARPTAPGKMRTFNVPAGDGGTIKMGAHMPDSEGGGIVERTQQKANAYNRSLPIPLADSIREDANAKLNSFYNMAGGDRNAALSNPETARVKAVGDSTRQQLYPKLDANAGLQPGTVAGLQEKYGLLTDVADIANKREPVFARHDPVTLSQKVAAGHGGPLATAFNWAKEKALNKLSDSDALVNSAVDRYQNPNGTPLQPRPGIIPRATFAAGRGAQGLGRFIDQSKAMTVPPLAYGLKDKRGNQ